MDKQRALKILKDHQEWRRGWDWPITDPTELGKAIDWIILNNQ